MVPLSPEKCKLSQYIVTSDPGRHARARQRHLSKRKREVFEKRKNAFVLRSILYMRESPRGLCEREARIAKSDGNWRVFTGRPRLSGKGLCPTRR